jgi:hypothetical protein
VEVIEAREPFGRMVDDVVRPGESDRAWAESVSRDAKGTTGVSTSVSSSFSDTVVSDIISAFPSSVS